jgi:hypothetical protein
LTSSVKRVIFGGKRDETFWIVNVLCCGEDVEAELGER